MFADKNKTPVSPNLTKDDGMIGWRGFLGEILIISMAKGWGGAEEYLELLSDRLSKKGIDCRTLVREGGAYSRRSNQRGDIIQIPYGLRYFLKLPQKCFLKTVPLIIHVNRYYDILRGWYLKKLRPRSILLLYQHCYLNHPHRIPLLVTDGIICISEFVKTSITARFPSFNGKIAVIKPGIDLGLFRGEKRDYTNNGPLKIGMVGRFDKNQQDLLRVAWELKNKDIPIKIHFAGSGKTQAEERLKGLAGKIGISGDVVFRGSIPHYSMPNFYLDMDICASTMRTEGLSLFAMEAMACGLPFICYDSPGFNEIINNRVNGILVSGGVREFASSLESLIKSSHMRKKIGENAAEKARENFGIQRNVDDYLSFLVDLITRNSNLV